MTAAAVRSWWGGELIAQGRSDGIWARARRCVTTGQLRDEIDILRGLFRAHGLRTGDTAALCGTPSFTQLWSLFALWSLGVQVIHLHPGVGAGPRRELLNSIRPQYLVTFGHGGTSFLDECAVLVRPLPGGRPASTSHCVVQFSSGTTGLPKAVGRTSESLLLELERLRMLDGMPAAGERVAVLASTAHSFGLVCGLLYALDAGATVVLPPTSLHDVDVVLGTPRHFSQLRGSHLRRLRLAVSSSEPLPASTYAGFLDEFGVRIGQAYGTTETGIIASDLTGAHGPSVVGKPVPGVRTLVAGGVLHVHVPQSPYVRHEDEPWLGGWMSTGDRVDVDPGTGLLRLRGRQPAGGRTRRWGGAAPVGSSLSA
jgi:acyl-coenzyme A synthetase/AMP-(fatty) acid ligase